MQGGEHPDDEPLEETQVKDSTRGLQDYIDLVNPNIIPHLKYIAEVMLTSGYDVECCQAYISIRKDALEECFLILEVEKLSIDDVLQMDWSSLSSKMKKWVQAVKTFIHVHLANEKCLAEKVFGVSGSVGQNCFIEASKSMVLQLLSFGFAVAIRDHSSETIFRTLYMYDRLADLLPNIDALYSDEAGSCVSTVAHEVLIRLGESVRTFLNESRNSVMTNDSSAPFAGGWVDHLMRYVVEDNTRGLEDYTIDLVNPNIIPHVNYLAGVMSASGYDTECCQAYISIRKDALEEFLLVLEVENLSIDDVLQMDWSSSYSEIKKWVRALKTFIRVILASEKCLADKVLGFSGSVGLGQNCFIQASKSLVLQLLSFRKTVVIRHHSSEMIFQTLYVYDGLADLLPDIDSLFSDEAGSCVSTVAHEVLTRLDESVRTYLNEFMNDLRRNELSTPFPGGGVHHLTRYVMSYLKALTDYSDTINFLLKGGGVDHFPSSSNVNMEAKDDSECSSSSSASPMARCLQSVISILESNLESKSQLYTDVSLQHFFLMNNICYMAQKVKNSELQPFVGENWITKLNEKFQQHAVSYRSASWNQVLSFLRDDDVHIPHSDSVSKAILKVRSQCFNLAFEEIYRAQTAWLIPDVELEDDLGISISSKLLQAYLKFLVSYLHQLAGENHSDQYIKYSVEDIQGFLFDLFQGSQRSLNESPSTDFYDILIETRQPFLPELLPFQSNDDDMSSLDLIISIHDGSSEGTKVRRPRNKTRDLEDYIVDLVHPDVIPDLKGIIEVMFASGYEAECCQAYISITKEALEECLRVLDVERLFINHVLQMDWSSLNSNIKKWVRAMKIFIYVNLASEKSLAGIVFGVSGAVSQTCFIEASKTLILQLLSFGEAVAIKNYSPEKILLLLYMYDAFFDLVPVIDVLFSDEAGSYVRNEAHGVLSGLGESITRTLDQFRNAVKTNASSTQFTEGGVHHLTRYVMKYLTALAYYSDTLNFILNVGGDDHLPSSLNVNTTTEVDGKCSSYSISPVSQWLQSTLSILKSNLQRKSLVYTNVSLRRVFMMNNLWYVAQNVKDSELQPLLGENWVGGHNGIFQQLVADYERTSWSLVRSFLRHEGVWNPRSSSVSKSILKERFQGFNLSFEEIYRKETAWLIHDEQLRIELRASISSKVLVEYRLFLERFSSDLKDEKHRDRYLKYSVEDLQESLLDLFKGSSKGLHKVQRR
ncbi:hypothetical protein ACLOJK_035593 [Asimina triloba]